jgi:glycosyltransferase involved in cell wall biosynthesis/MoaA/NifB/PqqE/SkfB family radical SAM enzyme
MEELAGKTNILWIVDHLGYSEFMHGAGKYYLNTIPYFDKNKFNVTLCVLRTKDNLTRQFEEIGITTLHLRRSKLDPRTLFDLIKLVRNENINLIHCHGYGSANFGRLTRIFTRVPTIIHSHDDDRNYPWYQRLFDLLLRMQIDKAIAISNAVKESSINKRKIPADRILVIYNGIPLDEFIIPGIEEIEAEKKRLGISPNDYVIGTVAKLREEKGIEYLLKSIPMVLNSFPNSIFLIVGDGCLRSKLENLARELKISQNVIFVGYCEKVKNFYSIFDMKVLPSLTEGFGLVIVEAMRMGKPIVATYVGGVKEILRDGETGLFVPPKDPKALAEKIIYLLENKDEAKCLGVKAKEESKKYDINLYVRKLEELYMIETLKKQLATRGSIFTEILTVIGEGVTNNVVRHFKTLKPTVLQLNVNARCNARCVICNIWQTVDKTEINIEKLEEVFSDPIFQNIEYIILSGGEPTLRKNLPDVVELMLKKMPKLRKISIPTTGIATERSVEHFSAIAKACFKSKVFLSIGISLDGVDEVYEHTRGIPGGYKKVINTLLALKELNKEVEFQLGIGSTISALNVYDVYNLIEVSEKLELGINFVVAALSESYFNNTNLSDNITFTPEAKEFLRTFLKERIKKSTLFSEMPFYYEKVLKMMDGAKRSIPCPFQDQGLVLDASGEVHYCTNSNSIGNIHQLSVSTIYSNSENLKYRRQVTKENCPECQISCFVGVGLRKKVIPFLGYLAKSGTSRILYNLR